MDKKNKLGLQYDPEGEKMISQQLSASYESGADDFEGTGAQSRERKSSNRRS